MNTEDDAQRGDLTGAGGAGSQDSPGRRARNKQQTRERLLSAATELFTRVGPGATVEEIAERARVSRATFFNYFPSKEHLVRAVLEGLMGQLDTLIDEMVHSDLGARDRIMALFGDLPRIATEQPGFIGVYLGLLDQSADSQTIESGGDVLAAQVARMLEGGAARAELRTDADVDFLAEMVASLYLSGLRFARPGGDPAAFGAYFRRVGEFAADAVTRHDVRAPLTRSAGVGSRP